jgi:hypothetical protein
MIEGKIQLCRQHWQQLAPHTKDRSTAKHLLAAVEIAERLIRENNKLEMENREYRLRETPYDKLRDGATERRPSSQET